MAAARTQVVEPEPTTADSDEDEDKDNFEQKDDSGLYPTGPMGLPMLMASEDMESISVLEVPPLPTALGTVDSKSPGLPRQPAQSWNPFFSRDSAASTSATLDFVVRSLMIAAH